MHRDVGRRTTPRMRARATEVDVGWDAPALHPVLGRIVPAVLSSASRRLTLFFADEAIEQIPQDPLPDVN